MSYGAILRPLDFLRHVTRTQRLKPLARGQPFPLRKNVGSELGFGTGKTSAGSIFAPHACSSFDES